MAERMLYLWARRMGLRQALFSWLQGVRVIELDHTWITDYEISNTATGFTQPISITDRYWFCWGKFHAAVDRNQNPKGGLYFQGPLKADMEEAGCICKPSVKRYKTKPSWPHGQIPGFYGFHGVCHQVANRILWSAGVQPDGSRITVKGVRGWQISQFVYGDYGTAGEWPIPNCNPGSDENSDESQDPNSIVKNMVRSSLPENFDPGKKQALQELRTEILKKKDQLTYAVVTPADRVQFAARFNKEIADTLKTAHGEILGAEAFQAFFGFKYLEAIPLVVNPEIAEEYKDEEFGMAAFA